LGAATAGGTIEAYKNVVGSQGIYGFEMNDMLTSIGLIKNRAPALQDSQIGNMAKYGIRTIANPVQSMQKNIDAAGLTAESFRTNGAFDLAKTHKLFWEMRQREEGMQKFQKLFAGRNVLASEFWNNLTQLNPEQFADYQKRMTGSSGALDNADTQRIEGIVGVMNRLRGVMFTLALTIGQILTPAISLFTDALENIVMPVSRIVNSISQSFPTLSGLAGIYLGIGGALMALGLISGRSASLVTRWFKLPWSVLAWAIGSLASGLGRLAFNILRFAGARGVLATSFLLLRGALVVIGPLGWAAAAGLTAAYLAWDKIKAFGKGFASAFNGSELETAMVQFAGWQSTGLYNMFSWLESVAPRLSGALRDIGSYLLSIFETSTEKGDESSWSWFDVGAKAAERLLNPLRSIREIGAALPSIFGNNGQSGIGVPAVIKNAEAAAQGMRNPRGGGGISPVMPAGMAMNQQGPSVTFTQASPAITNNVTVNVTQSNADPNAIGAAAAGAVGAKVRGALSDAPHSAP
jgi:hypothetical protein